MRWELVWDLLALLAWMVSAASVDRFTSVTEGFPQATIKTGRLVAREQLLLLRWVGEDPSGGRRRPVMVQNPYGVCVCVFTCTHTHWQIYTHSLQPHSTGFSTSCVNVVPSSHSKLSRRRLTLRGAQQEVAAAA